YVIVIHNLIDVALVIGTGEDNYLTLIPNELVKLLELVQEHKPVDDGHINVQKNETGKVLRRILILPQVIERCFSGTLNLDTGGELRYLDDTLTDKIISIIIID